MNEEQTGLHKESILQFFDLYSDKEKNPVAYKHMSRKIDELIHFASK